jgi:hypothetical protein
LTSDFGGVAIGNGGPSPAITQEMEMETMMTLFIVLTCIIPTLTVALLVMATDTEL